MSCGHGTNIVVCTRLLHTRCKSARGSELALLVTWRAFSGCTGLRTSVHLDTLVTAVF